MPAIQMPTASSEAIFPAVLTIKVLLLRFKNARLRCTVFQQLWARRRVSFATMYLYIQANPKWRLNQRKRLAVPP